MSTHDASHSALGYLYQSEWPLLELVRRTGEQPDIALTLELHDDVTWEKDGTPIELLQVKHHVDARRGMGDKDTDLWKTLGVWMDAHPPADPLGPILTLVTTSVASGGAAAALRPQSYEPEAARRLLDAAAAASQSAATQTVRDRYLALSEVERSIFVGRIHVLEGSPQSGTELHEALRKALYFSLPPGHEESFLEQLWGWWHRQAVDLLRRERGTVSGIDVRLRIQEIADGYKPDNLPTLVQRDDVNFDVEETFGDRVFVQQLRWIAHTATMLQKAMVDYYRAYTQRAEWVNRQLIGIGELEMFEENLFDEWERAFEMMQLSLGDDAGEPSKQQAGRELLHELSNQTVIRVRDRYQDPFFMRGRLHELADSGNLGWHPDFEALLAALLAA